MRAHVAKLSLESGLTLAFLISLSRVAAAQSGECQVDADCGHGFACETLTSGTGGAAGSGGASQGGAAGTAGAAMGGTSSSKAAPATGGTSMGVGGAQGVAPPSYCGDMICQSGIETPETCPVDCGWTTYKYCAPATCDVATDCADGYTCAIPTDLGTGGASDSAMTSCGDGFCLSPETNTNCPADCTYVGRCTPQAGSCATNADCATGFYCWLGGQMGGSAGTGSSGTSSTAGSSSGASAGTSMGGSAGESFLPPATGGSMSTGGSGGTTGGASGGLPLPPDTGGAGGVAGAGNSGGTGNEGGISGATVGVCMPGGSGGSGGTSGGAGGSGGISTGGTEMGGSAGTAPIPCPGGGCGPNGSGGTGAGGTGSGGTGTGTGGTTTPTGESGGTKSAGGSKDIVTHAGCSVASGRETSPFGWLALAGLALAFTRRRAPRAARR